MDIVLHDFSGHPFQAELSRRLAADGHRVHHVSARQYVSGKGHLTRLPGDPSTLTFEEIEINPAFQKYALWGRLRWELAYGRVWVRRFRGTPADVVIMCNVPLIAMQRFVRYARRAKVPWVFWHQDIYSFGLAEEVRRRFPGPVAGAGSRLLEWLEANAARRASQVVAIGDAFTEIYPRWRVPAARSTVIPNWAPLDKITPVERDNPRTPSIFGDRPGLRLLYAGTLGRKHNPLLLVELLRAANEQGVECSLTVVSEGEAADDLRRAAATTPGLTVLPFQPASDLSHVLGSADVLVGLLEPEATRFSIPSKVLSYMAAGRPILGLLPADNPAAHDITGSGGFVATPTTEGARSAVPWLAQLAADPGLVARVGRQSREIAEKKFDLDVISGRFTAVLDEAVTPGARP